MLKWLEFSGYIGGKVVKCKAERGWPGEYGMNIINHLKFNYRRYRQCRDTGADAKL